MTTRIVMPKPGTPLGERDRYALKPEWFRVENIRFVAYVERILQRHQAVVEAAAKAAAAAAKAAGEQPDRARDGAARASDWPDLSPEELAALNGDDGYIGYGDDRFAMFVREAIAVRAGCPAPRHDDLLIERYERDTLMSLRDDDVVPGIDHLLVVMGLGLSVEVAARKVADHAHPGVPDELQTAVRTFAREVLIPNNSAVISGLHIELDAALGRVVDVPILEARVKPLAGTTIDHRAHYNLACFWASASKYQQDKAIVLDHAYEELRRSLAMASTAKAADLASKASGDATIQLLVTDPERGRAVRRLLDRYATAPGASAAGLDAFDAIGHVGAQLLADHRVTTVAQLQESTVQEVAALVGLGHQQVRPWLDAVRLLSAGVPDADSVNLLAGQDVRKPADLAAADGKRLHAALEEDAEPGAAIPSEPELDHWIMGARRWDASHPT